MAKSAGEVIADRLRAGKPLSAFAVSQLRAQGQEGALRANAANVVRAMLEGRPISAGDLAEAERYHPDEAAKWRASGGRVARGSAVPASASVEVSVAPAAVETGDPLANARHERFAQAVAAGRTQADAYREAYPASQKWKPAAVHVHASTLAATPSVSARVEALKRAAADAAVIGAREFRERLTRQFRALDEAGEVEAMVKVGGLLAKCVPGLSEPERVEVRDGGVTGDYAPPPAVARMGDAELRALLDEA